MRIDTRLRGGRRGYRYRQAGGERQRALPCRPMQHESHAPDWGNLVASADPAEFPPENDVL
jgi:hypothetical protein